MSEISPNACLINMGCFFPKSPKNPNFALYLVLILREIIFSYASF